LRELHVDFNGLPAAVTITDYNYANPSAPLSGEHSVSGNGHGKIREYGYRVFSESEASRLAKVKAETMACRELTLHASGNVLGLRAGYTFDVDDGPADLPTSYLAIEVHHAGAVAGSGKEMARYTGLDANETYRVEVTAIPSSVQYRTPQATVWPRIYGFENGVVDGKASSKYAQIDDQGRYLVRFKFDASDLPDGSTSTYLRMMQPHGGSTEGFHFPLRKGTEVMVSFQGGDPDRPLIAGVAPNMQTQSPVTGGNFTQNVVRTGGNNHMVIEDLEGKQHLDLFTPTGKTNIHMGGPGTYEFIDPPAKKGDPSNKVKVDTTFYLATDGAAGFAVGGDWWENVGGFKKTNVAGAATFHYGGAHKLNIDGASDEFYNAARNTTVSAGQTDDITGGLTQTIKGGGKWDITGGWLHKVGGGHTDDYDTWETKAGSWHAKVAGTEITAKGDDFTVENGGSINLNSPLVKIKGASVKVDAPEHIKTTSYQYEFFGFKGAGGALKTDHAGIYLSGYGLKIETTGYSAGLYAAKGENGGAKVASFGAVFSTLGSHIKTAAAAVKNGAVGAYNYAAFIIK
jgi:type VI secretion system secreted protein VgrG